MFDRRAGEPAADPPRLTLVPDSALVIGGNPIFLPDFGGAWTGRIYVAWRISRLGKHIAARFALRYYDAVTLMLRASSPELERGLAAAGCASGLPGAIDSTVAPGRWVPVVPGDTLTAAAPGLPAMLTAESAGIDSLIASVSRYMTLKTGDVIGAVAGDPFDLHRDMKVVGSLDGTEVLRQRIK